MLFDQIAAFPGKNRCLMIQGLVTLYKGVFSRVKPFLKQVKCPFLNSFSSRLSLMLLEAERVSFWFREEKERWAERMGIGWALMGQHNGYQLCTKGGAGGERSWSQSMCKLFTIAEIYQKLLQKITHLYTFACTILQNHQKLKQTLPMRNVVGVKA